MSSHKPTCSFYRHLGNAEGQILCLLPVCVCLCVREKERERERERERENVCECVCVEIKECIPNCSCKYLIFNIIITLQRHQLSSFLVLFTRPSTVTHAMSIYNPMFWFSRIRISHHLSSWVEWKMFVIIVSKPGLVSRRRNGLQPAQACKKASMVTTVTIHNTYEHTFNFFQCLFSYHNVYLFGWHTLYLTLLLCSDNVLEYFFLKFLLHFSWRSLTLTLTFCQLLFRIIK